MVASAQRPGGPGEQAVGAVAVRDVGQARTLAVTPDASWYWGFVAAEEGLSARAHQRFWNNALRWLVRDPDLTPLQIQPDRPAVEPGEPVGLTISARGSDYGPGPGTRVGAQLVSEDGKVVARGEAVAGRDGPARIELTPPGPPDLIDQRLVWISFASELVRHILNHGGRSQKFAALVRYADNIPAIRYCCIDTKVLD